MGPSKSVLMLFDEEQKHIALFERYGAWLEAQHPEWMADFEIFPEPLPLPAKNSKESA